jgi:hypothetical protein
LCKFRGVLKEIRNTHNEEEIMTEELITDLELIIYMLMMEFE